MKKRLLVVLSLFFITLTISYNRFLGVYAQEKYVYLGGMTAGFVIDNEGATVIGVNEFFTEKGVKSPGKDAGIKQGDVIISLDGREINSASQIAEILSLYDGNGLTVVIERDGEINLKIIYPEKDLSGKYKLGLFIRDDFTGIGTITYITEEGLFGALGHPIADGASGKPLRINGGAVFRCTVLGVTKGTRGKAGEIRGIFDGNEKIGCVNKNTERGLFGKITANVKQMNLQKASTADPEPGVAEILCTVDGNEVKKYSASIVKTDKTAADNKNIVIKITDENLIEKTGGILQGMSGSPILQKGKIVGAITHVFINDPERGFGISIKNMMEE